MTKGVLLDLAGVLYDGDRAIPGSVDAVARLRSAGCPIRFLTNSTRSPRAALIKRLLGLGFKIAPEELFTPAAAASAHIRAHGFRPHFLIHPDLAEDFADLPDDGGEPVVVVGDAGVHFTYEAMNAAFRKLTSCFRRVSTSVWKARFMTFRSSAFTRSSSQ